MPSDPNLEIDGYFEQNFVEQHTTDTDETAEEDIKYCSIGSKPMFAVPPVGICATTEFSPVTKAQGPLSNASSQQARSLQAIRAEFHLIAGGGGAGGRTIGADDISRHWDAMVKEADESGGGSHSSRQRATNAQQKQALALRAAQLVQEMDLRRTGQVGIVEWVHFMLLSRSSDALRQVNSLLARALEKNHAILQDLQFMFDAADTTSSGTLSFSEISAMYSQKLWHLKASVTGPSQHLSLEELERGDPDEFARAAVQAMDVTGDGKVSYAEFMAYSLGRRKHEVLLHLYDLSNGAAEGMSPWVLGTQIEGVWHTGVVVYGKEYYYSKDTVFADAGDTSFGSPTRIISLGHTLWRQDELHAFVTTELKPIFQRDTYDVVTNNCNHFSDRVCMYLVGKHPPPEVLNQPELLLRARAVRVIRPMLNWWLRDRIVVREKGIALPQCRQRLSAGEHPPLGAIVTVHPAMGDGQCILGQVATPPEFSSKDKDMDASSSSESTANAGSIARNVNTINAPSGTGDIGPGHCAGMEASCGGIWGGTCGVAKPLHGPGQTYQGVWVQFLDVSFVATTGKPEVRVEHFPCNRLSLGGLREGDGEATFRMALKALSASTSGSMMARGAAPYRVPVPHSMSSDVDLSARVSGIVVGDSDCTVSQL